MSKRFPLIIMPWNGYLNILQESGRSASLKRVYEHLLPGGEFVLDVEIYSQNDFFANEDTNDNQSGLWDDWVKVDKSLKVRERKTVIPSADNQIAEERFDFQVDTRGKICTETTSIFIASLRAEEILTEIAQAGFDISGIWSNFTDETNTNIDRKLVICARKPD